MVERKNIQIGIGINRTLDIAEEKLSKIEDMTIETSRINTERQRKTNKQKPSEFNFNFREPKNS